MIIKSTDIKDTRYLSSQTPPDFSDKNYFLNYLQMKIDADWEYRPNRKWVEEEHEPGSEDYSPLEVVVQTIKSDKGEAVSDDWYRLVFKDCQKVVRIGTRYRFAHASNISVPDIRKNIWIALNQTQLSPTATQTVCRCNGTIGSLYIDENGEKIRHYEPVIQPDKLSGWGAGKNEVAVDINGTKVLMAQFNKYTKQYFLNQRFFIDTNAGNRENQPVYKIINIVRSNTLTTYDPTDVGIIHIYYELDQIGEKDDVENRIAYNGIDEDTVSPMTDEPVITGDVPSPNYYNFSITSPVDIPDVLTEMTFKPELFENGIALPNAPVAVSCSLGGASYADTVPLSNYVSLTNNNDGTYTIKRLKKDLTLVVNIQCEATAPDNSVYRIDFAMRLL